MTASCWEWTGWRRDGYGMFNTAGLKRGAHRVLFEAVCGPIPSGLQLDHLCRNRACVNPAHLEMVTSRENTLRGLAGDHLRASQQAKGSCPQGHQYTAENTYVYGPRRSCRICRREKRIARYVNVERPQRQAAA